MKDPESLKAALWDVSAPIDALITTAYGYGRRRKGDTLESVDDLGNRNLIAAAKEAGVGRFVFTSILTADRATEVPHFHQKARTEAELERSGLDWVALRPGGFLDTLLGMSRDGIAKGKLQVPVDPEARASTILSADVARCLADAARLPGLVGERIDLGTAQPTSIAEIARLLSQALGRPVEASMPPRLVIGVMFGLIGLIHPAMRDNVKAMAYAGSERYVADTTRQAELFGPPPTIEESVRRWAREAFPAGERAA